MASQKDKGVLVLDAAFKAKSAEQAQRFKELMDEFVKFCNEEYGLVDSLELLTGVDDSFIGQFVDYLQRQATSGEQGAGAISVAVQLGFWLGSRSKPAIKPLN